MKSRPNRSSNLLAASIGVAIATTSVFIHADDESDLLTLEEVVVTAQKRAQSINDVPLSVSAISGEKLNEAGIAGLEDLAAFVPNFQQAESSLTNVLSIRGVSSGANQGFEQSVVMYMDDIAMGRAPLARAPFMDLSRVEVLRGPQNVLFGKNSIGGALSLATNTPTEEFEGSVLVEYEPEYNDKMVQVVLSGPLTDSIGARVALRYAGEDGYLKNTTQGDDEPGREDLTGRVVLEWDDGGDWSALLRMERSKFGLNGLNEEAVDTVSSPLTGLSYSQSLASLSLTGHNVGSTDGAQDFRRTTNVSEHDDTETDNVSFTVNYDTDAFTFTSVTSYLSYEVDSLFDAGAGNLFRLAIDEEYEQISQEIRFVSPGGETFDWIAGAYYQKWDLEYEQEFLTDGDNLFTAAALLATPLDAAGLNAAGDFKSLREYEGESETGAIFAQVTWNLTDAFRLTAGARYTVEKKEATRSMNGFNGTTGVFDPNQAAFAGNVFGVDYQNLGEFVANGGILAPPALNSLTYPIHNLDDDRQERQFTPTIIAEMDITEDALGYFNWAKGAKSGGFDAAGNQAANFEYEDESVTSYELGIKLTGMLDGRLETNAALFYVDYTDLQVSQFDGTLGFVVGNAAEATSQGIEVDGRYLISEGLTMHYAAAYLDFSFDEYEGACGDSELITNPTLVTCDRSGSENVFSPNWSASVSLDYVTPVANALDFRATFDVNYTGDQLVELTLDESNREPGHTLVGLRLALESDDWTLALVGKNLTDREVVTASGVNPLSRALTGTAAQIVSMARPRTVAVQASYRF